MGNQYDQGARDWKDALSIPDIHDCSEAQHILVGDNFNKKVNPRHMTVDHQAKSLQYFHSFAAKNRIPTNHLDDTRSRGDIADLPISAFLPTPADCSVLRSNYIILVSRIIVKHIPYFTPFKKVVPMNIQHQYSKEMEKVSEVVCMLIFLAACIKGHDSIMGCIMIHQDIAHARGCKNIAARVGEGTGNPILRYSLKEGNQSQGKGGRKHSLVPLK